MTKRDKLIERFLTKPRDFSWNELTALLKWFGYRQIKTGKTGGSRARFAHPNYPPIILHRPHPDPTLKRYQLDDIEALLKQEGLL